MIEYKVKVYANGIKSWYLNGECHREDGPAVEYADGDKSWYLNGVQCTEEEHYNKLNPAKELTMSELLKELGYNVEELVKELGYSVKIVE